MPAEITELRVGRLVKAHGLKGGLKVELYTDAPEQRFVAGAEFTLQVPSDSPWHRQTITLTEMRNYNGHPVAFFDGVTDRNAAESLVKAILWVAQDVDAQAEDDAWYDHQLISLAVERDGERIGEVIRVDHFPAQDLLVVRTRAGAEVMVPFVKQIVPTVDIERGIVVVTPPLGLFEEVPADEAAEPDASHEAATPDSATS